MLPRAHSLARAAWHLASRAASTSGASTSSLEPLATLTRGAPAAALGASPAAGAAAARWAAAPSSLLVRGLHSSPPRRAADDPPPPAAALAQAPAPPLAAAPPPAAASASASPSAADVSSARAVLRGVAISPRKLDAFAALLRGLALEDALVQCRLHPKKAARICEKVLLSARANASNNHGLAEPRLRVAEAWVGRGSHLVRAAIHGRGRTGVRHKYRAHLTVVLREAAAAPRRRVRELPPLWERRKVWDMREGKGGGEARDARWWHWSPRQRAPAERALRGAHLESE